MINVLGLPLEKALDLLKENGIGDILVTRCAAPRDKQARGTLRVVRQTDGGAQLTVCAFKDSVKGCGNEDGD